MLPLILVAVGAYLIGDSVLGDKKSYADGGMMAGGGVLKVSKGENDKYYWNFTFEDGKEEKSVDGFKTSADAQRDFQYRSKYFKMAKGGEMDDEMVDLFEDYDDIPENVQKVLDKHSDAFENEDYKGLETAKKDLEKIGYTFEYGLDGTAYDLRKIGQKGRSGEEYAKGGKLVGKQKNLDVNKNGKLDAEDFKMLRGKKMANGGETKMPYKEFEETLREFEIEGGFGKTILKGYEMYYLPKGNPYLNTKFNHRNKKKAYQQYVKMDR